ncbi:hypothetical protein [Streptomyces sp. NPDC003299]
MSKVSSATVKRVTMDWARIYEGFDVWRPLRLMRRIGPVLQGVTLDRSTSGDAYFPTAHIHALTREFPVVSLTLGQRLVTTSGVQETVKFATHTEDYLDASRRLAEQARLSLTAPPSMEEIVGELHAFAVAQQELGAPPAINEIEDSVLISSVHGNWELTEQGLQLARILLDQWPNQRLPLDFPGKEGWISALTEKASNPDRLRATVEDQIVSHKLGKVRQVSP